MPVESAWRIKEEQTGKPLIVFLDQVEEVYTRPVADLPDELEQLLAAVQATFIDSGRRPQGKLVLSFRKEWLAELESQLVAYELPRSNVFLEPLDRRGIIEVVQGPTRSERLCERYRLTVEDGLAEIIADDLREDRDSAIAPTLQILLTKMWDKATEANYEHPQFGQELYKHLKRDGILLRDFLNQQIAAFRERYPEAVDSGLLLDIVALHTTPLGTANRQTVEQLQQQYAHLGTALPDLIQQCQDLHLLTVATSAQKESTKTTRLAHDTLAPLVREKFDVSDKPGQRARRILDNRSVDWMGELPGTPLDATDLAIVERGACGTRALTPTEQRLLEASRRERDNRLRVQRTLRIVGSVAVMLVTVLAVLAYIARNRAERNALAAKASLAVAKDAVDEMLAKIGSESLKNVPQMEQVRTALLMKAADLYRQLSAQEADSDALRREQAQAHYSLGEIQRITDERVAAALEYQLAIDQFQSLLDGSPEQPQYRLDLVKTYNKFGYMLSTSTLPADHAAAESMYASALEQCDLLDDESRRRIAYQTQQALTLNNRGILRMNGEEPEEARSDFDAVINMLLPCQNEDPSSDAMKEGLLVLAYAYNNRAMIDGTITDYQAAIAIAESLHNKLPNDREVQLELAKWHNNLAGLYSDAGDYKRADEHSHLAVQLFLQLAAAAANVRSELAYSYLTCAAIREGQQGREAAIAALEDAKALFADLLKVEPENRDYTDGMQFVKDYEDRLARPAETGLREP